MQITFGKLTYGDRFRYLDNVWTKIDPNVARQHRQGGKSEPGNRMDGIYSIEASEVVEFLPVKE